MSCCAFIAMNWKREVLKYFSSSFLKKWLLQFEFEIYCVLLPTLKSNKILLKLVTFCHLLRGTDALFFRPCYKDLLTVEYDHRDKLNFELYFTKRALGQVHGLQLSILGVEWKQVGSNDYITSLKHALAWMETHIPMITIFVKCSSILVQ